MSGKQGHEVETKTVKQDKFAGSRGLEVGLASGSTWTRFAHKSFWKRCHAFSQPVRALGTG